MLNEINQKKRDRYRMTRLPPRQERGVDRGWRATRDIGGGKHSLMKGWVWER